MKLSVTILFLLMLTTVTAQQKPIDSYAFTARDLDHKGCVKSIRVTSYNFYGNKNERDTIYREYLAIYKDKDLVKRMSFSPNSSTPNQEIYYDTLGRITTLKRKDYDGKNFQIIQSFSNTCQYPDSTNIYFDDKKGESYIHTFRDTLVIKQEYYLRDTLKRYSTFKYDELNRPVEVIKVNTKHGFGVTLGKSITGTKEIKSVYPNDSITYRYYNVEDTLVTEKYKKGELEKIFKVTDKKKYRTEITEDYRAGYLSNKTSIEKYKDSTSYTQYSFNKKRDTLDILIQNQNQHELTSNWIHPTWTSTSKVIIKTENDSRGNWIKKTEIRNGVLEDKIFREIEYCD